MRPDHVASLLVLVMLVLGVAPAWATQHLQKQPPKTPAPREGAEKRETAAPIKVEVEALSMQPPAPALYAAVTIYVGIRNTGAGTVAKVPWAIRLATDRRNLAEGDLTNVRPGEYRVVEARWTATGGTHLFQAYVDPTGTQLKNTAAVASQVKELSVTVLRELPLLKVRMVQPGTITSSPAGIDCQVQGPMQALPDMVCHAWFDENASVTLTANPGRNRVVKWQGGGCPATGTTCTISMGSRGSALEVKAVFERAE